MNKILTIAIPTFNRAHLLDNQLNWVANAIKGFESQCEVFVSNNCSSDNTPEVLTKWRAVIEDLKVNSQPTNIGAIRNISHCIKSASGQFVWVLSDDDRPVVNTIAKILQYLRDRPDLGVLFLNYSSRRKTGELVTPERFHLEYDDENENGKILFEKYLAKRSGTGALVFTSALIYRTELAQKALDEWQSGVNNLMFQLYLTGFCTMKGRFLVTKDIYLEFIGGNSFFRKDRKLLIQIQTADIPQIYAKLAELGYSRELCRDLLLRRWQFMSLSMWRRVAKSIAVSPLTTLKALIQLFDAKRQLSVEPQSAKSKIQTSQ